MDGEELYERLRDVVGANLASLLDPDDPDNDELRAMVDSAIRGMVAARLAGDAAAADAAKRRLGLAAQRSFTRVNAAQAAMSARLLDVAFDALQAFAGDRMSELADYLRRQ